MTPTQLLIGILWIAQGVLAAGLLFANIQGRWPESAAQCQREDRVFTLLIGIGFGPLALFVALLLNVRLRYGWRLR